MSKVQKIKKGHSNPFEFWGMLKKHEKAIVCVPLLVAVIVVIAVFAIPHKSSIDGAHAALETKFTTNGSWSGYEKYGIDIWLPADIAEETIEGEQASYSKLHATRDKGGFPEITVGSFIVPEVTQAGLDIAANPNDVLNVIRPYMYDAFASMFNGVVPALNGDINIIKVGDDDVLEFTGTAELTVVYQDPTGKRDNGEPYSELTDTNIYYMVRIFNGRPVCVWGTWDYSTYKGEEQVKAAVLDGITSVVKMNGAKLKDLEIIPGSDYTVEKDDGISSADKEDGLVTVPYQGADGTQSGLPVDEFGNPVDVEGWVTTEGDSSVVDDTEVEPVE